MEWTAELCKKKKTAGTLLKRTQRSAEYIICKHYLHREPTVYSVLLWALGGSNCKDLMSSSAVHIPVVVCW